MVLLSVLEGAGGFLAILFAALLHEAGHFTAIKAFGAEIRRVDINVLSALIVYDGEGLSLRQEVTVALSGALFNLLSALAGSLLLCAYPCAVLLLFVAANLFFALINLLPVCGNDGGSALLFALQTALPLDASERIATVVSVSSRAVFALLFFLSLFVSGGNIGVALLFLLLAVPRIPL